MPDELHPAEFGLPEPENQPPVIKSVRHTKTPNQKLAALQEQIAKAQEEIRRHDARRKIVLGGACLSMLKRGPVLVETFDMNMFRALLWSSLSEKDQIIVHDLFFEPS